MKSSTITTLISYFLLLSINFSCRSSEKKDTLVLTDNIDLGAVTVGDKKNFTIDLLNSTSQDLKIVNVKGSCECITINNCPKGLKSEQNGTINATYDSKYERKLPGVLYKNVVILMDKKPFIHSVKLKVNIK